MSAAVSLRPSRREHLSWLRPDDDVRDVVAMRRATYGGELGWMSEASEVAWDVYDLSSTTLVVRVEGALVSSARLTLDSVGPLEVSDMVDWKPALPPALRACVAAEWSRVMVVPAHRRTGTFRRMFLAARDEARRRGASVLCGASVVEKRPHYERLGFTYLELPFRSPAFEASPVYLPAYQVIA